MRDINVQAKIKNYFNFFVLFIISLFTFVPVSYGITTSNDTYIIQVEDSLLPNQFPKKQPKASDSSDSIVFSFDGSKIEFDPLTPTNPLVRTRNLSVSTTGGNGYSISAYLVKPLSNETGGIIQNTSCDDGACTISHPSLWTSSLTYGFGFRCEKSSICDESFAEENTFSPMPNDSKSSFINIKYDHIISNSTIKFLYKINTAGSQEPGNYTSTIKYLVMPNI